MQMIYVFMGMVASGKSTLAEMFAENHKLPYYNTDRVRKEIAGLDPVSKRPDGVGQGIYTAEFTRKTYQALLDRAGQDLAYGRPGVVLDGSYARVEERNSVRELAAAKQSRVMFIHCVCSDDETRRRLEERARDPEAVSDGRWEIYLAQKEKFVHPDELGETELLVLDTEKDREELAKTLSSILGVEKK